MFTEPSHRQRCHKCGDWFHLTGGFLENLDDQGRLVFVCENCEPNMAPRESTLMPSETALAIYVVMARDVGDALEMIEECQDREALGLLQAVLTATGNPDTDQELNALFARPVSQRLDQLGGPVAHPGPSAAGGAVRRDRHE
jgi:hypothetical protein